MPFKRLIYQFRFAVCFYRLMRPHYSFRRCLGWSVRPADFDHDPAAEAEELAKTELALLSS